jgi:hypothetical protein
VDNRAVGRVVGVVETEQPSLKSLLIALANVMHDTASRFEDTSSRVAQIVLGGAVQEGGDLVATLQNFDRLRQELAAIGDVLSGCIGPLDGVIGGDSEVCAVRELVRAVPVADLRRRLLTQLAGSSREPAADQDEVF